MKLYKWYTLQNDKLGYPCHIDKDKIGNFGASGFNISKQRLSENDKFFLLKIEKPYKRHDYEAMMLKILFNGEIRYILIDDSVKNKYFFSIDNETIME